MAVLKINNDYSYLVSSNQELKEKLWQVLRFRSKDYFHSRAYQQGKWDGYINFFDKKSGKFLSGLLPEVEMALNYLKSPYKKQDLRKHTNFKYDKIDDQFLNQWLPKDKKPITLEDYQVDFVNQAIINKRGIIESPTGSGKTYMMVGILKALEDVPTLFLCNRKTVVKQNYKEFINWGFKNVGLFDGKHHEPNLITCSTLQSLHHLYNLLPKFKALVVDEVHMMMSSKGVKAYKKLTGCDIRIALSATPFKFGGTDKVHKYSVKGFFGPILETETTKTGKVKVVDLQERGRLSQSKCTFFNIDEPQIPYDIYLDAATRGIAQSWYLHKTVHKLINTLKGRTLIIVERLAHGDALHSLMPNSLWIQGKDDDETREVVIKQLQESTGDIVAIATGGIFNVGVNVFVHNLINAAGGKAEHEVIQRIGRGVRPADDKELLNYYDFFFKINPYLENHSNQRVKILKKEGHEVIVKDIDF